MKYIIIFYLVNIYSICAFASEMSPQFHSALFNCQTDQVIRMVNDGADPNSVFKNTGEVALEISWACPLAQFQFLLNAGANTNTGALSDENVAFPGENIVNGLMFEFVLNGNQYADSPRPVTPDFYKILDLLGSSGLSFNARSTENGFPSNPPIDQLAQVTADDYAYRDMQQVAEKIIQWGADPMALSASLNESPLESALILGNLRLADILLQHGVDVNADGVWAWASDLYNAFHRNNDEDQADMMVKVFDETLPQVTDIKLRVNGVPAVFQAVESSVSKDLPQLPTNFDRFFVLNKLMAAGVDYTTLLDNNGDNILGFIIGGWHAQSEYLVDIDELATIELAKLLMQAGVRPDLKNKDGISAIDFAGQRQFKKLQQFLKQGNL